jgi:hypothetical protein
MPIVRPVLSNTKPYYFLRGLLSLKGLAQVLSGAGLYYTCEAVFDSLAFRQGRESSVPAIIALLSFGLAVAAFFVFLTIAWYRFFGVKGTPYPEINLILGLIIFMPIYFMMASYLIYDPRPLSLKYIADELLWLYLLLPLSIISIATYTFTFHALILASASAVVAGHVMRRKTSAPKA